MLIIEMLVNENLIKAESALNGANSENIVQLCGQYLQVLTDYRQELYKIREIPEINLEQPSLLARELIDQVRKTIRSAIEITTRERNRTELLLASFTTISGYEVVNTFNQLKYKGFDNWELKANAVYSQNNGGFEQIAIQEAIEDASLLRRESYIRDKTLFHRS